MRGTPPEISPSPSEAASWTRIHPLVLVTTLARLETDELLSEVAKGLSPVPASTGFLTSSKELIVGPLIDGMIVGERLLGSLVQRTAINACRFISTIKACASLPDSTHPLQVVGNRRAIIKRIVEEHASGKRGSFYSQVIYRS